MVPVVIDRLLRREFLVIDGGETVLKKAADPDAGSAVVEHPAPGVELQWQLERVRQFLFGVLRVDETDAIDADIEALLEAV